MSLAALEPCMPVLFLSMFGRTVGGRGGFVGGLVGGFVGGRGGFVGGVAGGGLCRGVGGFVGGLAAGVARPTFRPALFLGRFGFRAGRLARSATSRAARGPGTWRPSAGKGNPQAQCFASADTRFPQCGQVRTVIPFFARRLSSLGSYRQRSPLPAGSGSGTPPRRRNRVHGTRRFTRKGENDSAPGFGIAPSPR
jgi:hypothetical protein